jgi:hypothetical protein
MHSTRERTGIVGFRGEGKDLVVQVSGGKEYQYSNYSTRRRILRPSKKMDVPLDWQQLRIRLQESQRRGAETTRPSRREQQKEWLLRSRPEWKRPIW